MKKTLESPGFCAIALALQAVGPGGDYLEDGTNRSIMQRQDLETGERVAYEEPRSPQVSNITSKILAADILL